MDTNREAEIRAAIDAKLQQELNEKNAAFISGLLNQAEAGDLQAQFDLAECLFAGDKTDKNVVQAIDWFTKAAKNGFVPAQKKLYNCYNKGEGVPKDYCKAMEWCEQLALAGDTRAQVTLGNSYFRGDCMPQDYTKAVEWYVKSAEQGYSVAQSNLGLMYYSGLGVAKDYTMASKWYLKSAEQNFARAQYRLGFLYENGWGVVKDISEAIKWYEKSAEQGNATAQCSLGCLMKEGTAGFVDNNKAAKYLKLAAEQGNAKAQLNLGIMYEDGLGLSVDLYEARRLYTLSAERGNAEAQLRLGIIYCEGKGTSQDAEEGVKWLMKSAEQGNSEAQNRIGCILYSGFGIEKDYSAAFGWFKKSAEQGNASAQFNLGVLYSEGHGINRNYEEANKWFKLSAEQGHTEAQFSLANCIYSGIGATQNYMEAMSWFKKAANQGNANAQNMLGVMCYKGHGVSVNYTEAMRWFIKAADSWHQTAQNNLGSMYYDGIGTDIDYAQAFKWFALSANNGQSDAQYRLGSMFSQGIGVDQDYAAALLWFGKSADQGNSNAENELGLMYANGLGIPQDYSEAKKWFERAIEHGNENARTNLNDMFNIKQDNASELTESGQDVSTSNKEEQEKECETSTNEKESDEVTDIICSRDEGEDVLSQIEKDASIRFTKDRIPISYFNDYLNGKKSYNQIFESWQTNGNSRKNFFYCYNDEQGKQKAIESINQLIISVILNFPIKKVHVNIIDLDNTLDFVSLSGNLDSSIVSTISNTSELRILTDKLDERIKIISTTPEFNTLEDYNEKHNSFLCPYELVVVSNYQSSNFSMIEESLLSYFVSGSRFGVYFIALRDTSKTISDYDKKAFLDNKECFHDININSLIGTYEKSKGHTLVIDHFSYGNKLITKEQVYRYINSEANKKHIHVMDWNHLINSPYPDMDSDIDAPIGFSDDGTAFNFRMGVANSHYHAFVIGATGSGKSRFLHDIIFSMTIKYKPEDLELYLMDFKGVEFNDYKNLKHVRTVLVNRADEQITYEVIKDLKSTMEEREKLLRNAGASDVAEYNRNNLGKHISQIIFIADECQTIFADRAKNGTLQNEMVDTIALIAQQGRAYGVHLLLATQSLANAPQLGKDILNQISDYYILPCLPEDAARLVPDYARLETEKVVSKMEKGKGQCYYRGPGETALFLYNYVEKGEMQSHLVQAVVSKAECHHSNGQLYFNGYIQHIIDNTLAKFIADKKSRSIFASPGQEISLSQKPITITLKENYSENILLAGINDEHFVTRTTINILASLMITNAKKGYGYRFIVFDCLSDEDADYYDLLWSFQEAGLCELIEPKSRCEVLKRICDDISLNVATPTILLVLGQERFRELKLNVEYASSIPDKNDFDGALNALKEITFKIQNSNEKSPNIETVSDAIKYILERGPENHIHTIMQLDKISNYLFLDYVRKDDVYRFFKHLVLLRSDADAAVKLSLNDQIHLDRMEGNPDRLRAYYYNEESDKYQLFTPFVLPTFENITNLIR